MKFSRRNLLKTGVLSLGVTFIPSWSRAGILGGSPNDVLQIGVIGTGKQGNILAGYLARMPEATITAACDVFGSKMADFVTAERERQMAGDVKAAVEVKTYATYQELLAHPGLDAVIVATPDHQHAQMCIDALDKGLHVYCEKPLAHTVEEGRAMADAVERSGKVLQTGSMQRSMFTFQHAKELIEKGGIGEIREILVSIGEPPRTFDLPEESIPTSLAWKQWIGPSVMRNYNSLLAPPSFKTIYPKWRDYAEFGGGMVTDWGAHMFDIVQWVTGHDNGGPVSFYPPGGDDPKEGLTMFYDNGIRVTHQRFRAGNAVRFVGTEGSIDVARGYVESTVPGLVTDKMANYEQPVQANVAHFQDFFAGIREGKQVICPAETGHRSASVCTLSNIAYRLKRPIYWNPASERIRNDREANELLGPAYRYKLR